MKSPWEERVGMLLDPAKNVSFVWSFKPVDSMAYGGQPRIDWIACDLLGWHWLIEVKKLADFRKTFNLLNDISPGQRQTLDAVAESLYGVSLLAIGHGTTLYIFDWRDVAWLLTPENADPPLLRMETALLSYVWSGPKKWQHRLYTDYQEKRLDSAPALTPHAVPSHEPGGLRSISRPGVCIRTPPRMPPLGP